MTTANPGNGGKPPLLSRLARAVRGDGWQNVLTGLGTITRDKNESTEFIPGAHLSAARLEALYRQDDMAARICETLPNEMLRKGFEVKVESDKEGVTPEEVHKVESDILASARSLHLSPKIVEAMVWGRLFGGGAIFIGANDGADERGIAEPLNEKAIQTVESLTVLDKQYLTVHEWYRDPTEPLYGEPKTYYMTPSVSGGAQAAQIIVHHTRLVTFYGTLATIQARQQLEGWTDSVLQRPAKVLRDFNTGWQAVAHLFTDAAQAVFKIKGLIDQIAAGNTDTILTRMRLVDMNRSVARAIAVDSDTEDFTRQPYNFGNVDAVLDKFILRLAAAARMPVTILMGQSPAGMDATGESDLQWWYDSIVAERNTACLPQLERLLEILMLAKDGPTGGKVPENWSVIFPSLWEPTQKEETEIRKNMAETDTKYITEGVLLPEEVTLSRFGGAGYSIETSVDAELRQEMLELQKERARNEASEEE